MQKVLSPGIMWLRERRLQEYGLVMIHDDEYLFCVRNPGKLHERI